MYLTTTLAGKAYYFHIQGEMFPAGLYPVLPSEQNWRAEREAYQGKTRFKKRFETTQAFDQFQTALAQWVQKGVEKSGSTHGSSVPYFRHNTYPNGFQVTTLEFEKTVEFIAPGQPPAPYEYLKQRPSKSLSIEDLNREIADQQVQDAAIWPAHRIVQVTLKRDPQTFHYVAFPPDPGKRDSEVIKLLLDALPTPQTEGLPVKQVLVPDSKSFLKMAADKEALFWGLETYGSPVKRYVGRQASDFITLIKGDQVYLLKPPTSFDESTALIRQLMRLSASGHLKTNVSEVTHTNSTSFKESFFITTGGPLSAKRVLLEKYGADQSRWQFMDGEISIPYDPGTIGAVQPAKSKPERE